MSKFDVKALREKALSSDDIKYDSIFVEEWEVELPVKSLSSAELKQIRKAGNDEIRMAILSVIHGCKTKEGEAVFTATDLAEFEQNKSFGAIQKIASKVFEISGLTEEEQDVKND